MKKLVVLSNMGGAGTPAELKLFLKNMFRDKRIIPGLVRFPLSIVLSNFRYKKVWKNYEKIGGSAIYAWTEKLVKRLKVLTDYDVALSMRYTKPYLQDVTDTYDEVLVVPMYPHYSTTTTGSILDEIESLNFKGNIKMVPAFYKEPAYNLLIKNTILSQIKTPSDYHLIFSAHGLPQYIIKKGDPYVKQIYEHVEILKNLLGDFKSISVGFQSRLGPVKWQKPYLEEVLAGFKNEKVVIYPISFLIDNSETDFELKIEYAEIAKHFQIKDYQVVNCLNDHPDFAQFLAGLIQKHF